MKDADQLKKELIFKYAKVLLLALSLSAYLVNAQPAYQVEGRYKKQPAQGMAIYNDYAYLLNNTGLCRVYSLKEKKVVGEYELQCIDDNNHANCASIGYEMTERNAPLLYISQCRRPTYYCYVESVGVEGSKQIQRISLNCQGENGMAHDWIVDTKNRVLYSVTTVKVLDERTGLRRFHFVKFRLPTISEGENVVLTDNDVLDDFSIEYPNILQGGTINGKYLYLPMGVGKTHENGNLGRTLVVINLKKRIISKEISLDNLIDDEPEDCAFYKNKLLLYCGQSGGLYEVPLNDKDSWLRVAGTIVNTISDIFSKTK